MVLVQAREDLARGQLRALRGFWRRRAAGGYLATLVQGGHWDMLESAEIHRVSRTINRELQRFDAQEGK